MRSDTAAARMSTVRPLLESQPLLLASNTGSFARGYAFGLFHSFSGASLMGF